MSNRDAHQSSNTHNLDLPTTTIQMAQNKAIIWVVLHACPSHAVDMQSCLPQPFQTPRTYDVNVRGRYLTGLITATSTTTITTTAYDDQVGTSLPLTEFSRFRPSYKGFQRMPKATPASRECNLQSPLWASLERTWIAPQGHYTHPCGPVSRRDRIMKRNEGK